MTTQELVFNAGAVLAREGELAQAEEVLTPLLRRPDVGVDVLDLMARICAQDGRFQEAVQLWNQVLLKDPTNSAAHEGIRAALRRSKSAVPFRAPILALVGSLVVGLAIAIFFAAPRRPSRILAATSRGNTSLPSAKQAHAEVPQNSIAAAPSVSGWITEVVPEGIELIPASSVFSYGTVVTAAGDSALHELRSFLSSHTGYLVELRGTTDLLPLKTARRFRSNGELAAARAARAAEVLTRANLVSDSVIVLRFGRQRIHPSVSAAALRLRSTRSVIAILRQGKKVGPAAPPPVSR